MINFGLGTFEPSEQEIGSLYNQTKSGFWETAGATFMNAWNYNPTSSVLRAVEQTKAYQSSSEYLDRDELNKQYGHLGLVFEKDTRSGLVDYLVERKELENERADVIARGPDGKLAKSFFFLESLGTSFLDPINLAASFVPVVGQARFANMVARSGKNVARMKKGLVEGFVGNTAVEPLVYGVAKSEQANYDAWDSFANIAVGGFIGSAAHVGFGRIGDFIAEKRGKPNIYQKLAAISPENQQALLRYSVGKVLKGEKVDTGNVIVEKTRIGDEGLNKIDNQIKEYKRLYKDALGSDEKIPQEIDIIADEKILKNIDDFEITSQKDYFSVSSKTKESIKEYSGIPASKQEKYIIQTEYSKDLNAMVVNDVKISKKYRNTGAGKALYKIAIKNAFDKKLNFVSDDSISESALRVYKSLEKEGFEVSYNKNVTTKKRNFGNDEQRGNQIVSNDSKIPVVTIKNKFKNVRKKPKDRKSAKIYLQNLRNLQKTERDLFAAKRKQADEAKLQEQKEGINANNKKNVTEVEQTRKEKETSEIEIEGENLNQTVKFRQKQLDIKDEDISVLDNSKNEIEKVNNNIKNKTKLREAIEAGTHCTKRNS